MKYVIFDIETRVDRDLIDRLYSNTNAAGYDLLATQLRQEQRRRNEEPPFFPLAFHIPVSIAVGQVGEDFVLSAVKSVSPVKVIGYEEQMCRAFWKSAESFDGCFVSYNGRAFDFPVLELAAYRYGIPIPRGFKDKFGRRYRFQMDKHLDLQELMTNNGVTGIRGGLATLCEMVGARGKGAVNGSMVQELVVQGQFDLIDRYCRNDVRRTYSAFLFAMVMLGQIERQRACDLAGIGSGTDLGWEEEA